MSDLIFDDGYRANVGIVICNPSGKVFFGKRRYQSGWQFPQGGIKEGEKFFEWYSKTLKSYKNIFGMNPPVNIWPEPSVRFREGQMWQWIDTSEYVLVHQSMGFVMILIGLLFFLGLAWLGTS